MLNRDEFGQDAHRDFLWGDGPDVEPDRRVNTGQHFGRGAFLTKGIKNPLHLGLAAVVLTLGPLTADAASGYGNLVAIDHGRGISTAYGHQSSIAVSLGQSVSQGQTIGYVGCTGHCFGPHLHFEVRINGTPVDPLGYL